MLTSVSDAPPTAAALRSLRLACYVLFTASGFAGLIYESVWSHYIKLVLGHAAYAQTLVLAIFMGGMATGSWLASRLQGARVGTRPLVLYAWVEAVLALFAFSFHSLFEWSTHWLAGSLAQLSDPTAIALSKWGLGAGLILPEAVLLGMTFPLMSVGVMRLVPEESGETLATLYFSNSFGAVIGVLGSGFLLIPAVGLPGTVLIAGAVNAFVAAAVTVMLRAPLSATTAAVSTPLSAAGTVGTAGEAELERIFLAAAAITGLASFCYEIAWIRMLSMVLGSSVQAFELMLAAFISGLALGSLYIRRRIDAVADPVRLSGYVQVAMGLVALATLVLYASTFDVMAYLVGALPKSDAGYMLFNVSSALLALSIMLPATLLAGTTLPLFTHVLVRGGHGERSIGRVYAANTLGGIAAVLLSVHLVMPQLGVRGVIGVGAALDVGLGCVLLLAFAPSATRSRRWLATVAVGGVFAALLGLAPPTAARGAASVFRTGAAQLAADTELVFHRDGKTATVDVTRARSGELTIATNGKPDASANITNAYGTPDEVTGVAAAAFVLAHLPETRRVANIGFGSGMTTHAMLGVSSVQRLDTIEIEPAMVDGARAFGKLSERAYTDPRSRIFIEDAKTFLSSQREPYDVIVSEPSNPWVSGVASLFSREFYRDVKRHLRPHGLFVQWSQLYETDLDNLASVFKALGEQFSDYVVYATNDLDMLIVATPEGAVQPADPWVFTQPAIAADMARVGLAGLRDIEARRFGDRRSLEGLFLASPAPANSDFYPYLSYRAPRTRFLGKRVELSALLRADSPVPEMLDSLVRAGSEPWTESPFFVASGIQRLARWAHAVITSTADAERSPRIPPSLPVALRALMQAAPSCDAVNVNESALHAALHQVASLTTSTLSARAATEIWQRLRTYGCFEQRSAGYRAWFSLYAANAARDAPAMQRYAAEALQLTAAGLPREYLEFALTAGSVGALRASGPAAALAFYGEAHRDYMLDEQSPLALRLIVSTAAWRAGRLAGAPRSR